MFFFLSKVLYFLIMPLTIIIGLWITSIFIKSQRWKRNCGMSGLVLCLFFTNEFVANETMLWWEVDAVPYAELKPHQLGIVLTGATMSFVQPADRIYFSKGADRVTHTVDLYKRGLVEKILISGGSGMVVYEEEPEANKFQRAMIMMGVSQNDIWIENETRNTQESAIQVKQMLDSLAISDKDCFLITSAFHMRRSQACYAKVGLYPDSFSTDFYTHPRKYTLASFLVPSLNALLIWHKLVKEWVGLLAYKVMGYA